MTDLKPHWYPWYLEDYSSSPRVALMTLEEEGAYRRLLDHQFQQGWVPKSVQKQRAICKNVSSRKMANIWRAIADCFEELEDGSGFVNPRMQTIRAEAMARLEQLQRASRLGVEARRGKPSGRPNGQPRGQPSGLHNHIQRQTSPPESSSKTPPEKKNSPQGSSNLSGRDSLANARSSSRERPKDEAWEYFAGEFKRLRNVPYGQKQADFVQLAKLRKLLGVEARQQPRHWSVAVGNYLASELSKYTLADLCVRYDVFLNSPLDRFGRTPEVKNANERHERNREAIQRAIEEIRDRRG